MREVNPTTGQQGGVVLNVTSMGGRAAFPGNAFYHASKFAVEGFTESVAREVKPGWGIHFCCVEPGGVRTDFSGRSTVRIEQHEAYGGPDSVTRRLEKLVEDEEVQRTWASAEGVANKMWELVEGGRVPLRVPLGGDAWGVLKGVYEREGRELDEWRGFSESVGGSLEGIKFLVE